MPTEDFWRCGLIKRLNNRISCCLAKIFRHVQTSAISYSQWSLCYLPNMADKFPSLYFCLEVFIIFVWHSVWLGSRANYLGALTWKPDCLDLHPNTAITILWQSPILRLHFHICKVEIMLPSQKVAVKMKSHNIRENLKLRPGTR